MCLQVLNSLGQEVFYAKEETDCCTRQCCGPSRPFDMRITDNQEREVGNRNRLMPSAALLYCLGDAPGAATSMPVLLLPLLPARARGW